MVDVPLAESARRCGGIRDCCPSKNIASMTGETNSPPQNNAETAKQLKAQAGTLQDAVACFKVCILIPLTIWLIRAAARVPRSLEQCPLAVRQPCTCTENLA